VNDDGKIKIANVFSWPNELPSFVKTLDQYNHAADSLLAPEDFALLQSNHLENNANEQSEVFAIGASIIYSGILDDFSSVYNYKQRTFNMQAFFDKKRIWGSSDRYSDIFKSIILNLVDANPVNRLTIDELWAFIHPYEASILEKKQFMIQGAPPKVENSFAALRSKVY